MFIVFGILITGVFVGLLLSKVQIIQKLNHTIIYTIYLLLFMLGLSVGSNDQIMHNLSSLGVEALAISLAGCLGSALAAWFIYKYFFKAR